MQVQDLKERTARENFKKLKMSIIEEMEHNDSRRGTLASLEGADRVKGRQAKREGSPGISDALVGAGVRLYQPLLPIREEEDLRGVVNGAVNTADTSAREDRPDSSPRTKHVRIKTEPELLDRPEIVPGCTSLCPSPSLDGQCGNHTVLMQERDDLPPWPDPPETEALIHSPHSDRALATGDAFRLNIWVPQLPASSPKLQHKNTYVTAYIDDPWTPKSSAISSVWYKKSRSLYAE